MCKNIKTSCLPTSLLFFIKMPFCKPRRTERGGGVGTILTSHHGWEGCGEKTSFSLNICPPSHLLILPHFSRISLYAPGCKVFMRQMSSHEKTFSFSLDAAQDFISTISLISHVHNQCPIWQRIWNSCPFVGCLVGRSVIS